MFGLYETGFGLIGFPNVAMLMIGGLLLYLGIAKKIEPILLVPIGFGILMVNLPLAHIMEYTPYGLPAEGGLKEVADGKIGILNLIYNYGLRSEVLPLLIFLGVGSMMDFRPTIARPLSLIYGAAGQVGVFAVFVLAYLSGMFTAEEAAAVAIIGGSDGPPAVFLGIKLAPHLLGPITMIAYAYMALVPILQPPVIRLLTTKKEREIYMPPHLREVSKFEEVMFPIVVFVLATMLVPGCAPLVGMLMFGNLLRVCGVTDRLTTAAGTMNDILLILLGVTVGALMPAQVFFSGQTILILLLAVLAFIFSTAGGLIAAKITNLFTKTKINPIIGAAGVSAIPMASRVAQREGQRANPRNFLIMHALGPNMAGAIGTSIVAGILLGMLG